MSSGKMGERFSNAIQEALMSTQAMLTDAERALQEEVADFVASVPRDLLVAMDADEVQYPREFIQEAGRRHQAAGVAVDAHSRTRSV